MESITLCMHVESAMRRFVQPGIGMPLDTRLALGIPRSSPGHDDWHDLGAQLAWRAAQWLNERRIDPASVLSDVVIEPLAVRLEMRGYLWPRLGVPVE